MMKFIEKVKATNFGDNASYEVYKPSRTGQTPREMIQDWNAVIRGVDPDIELEDFETAMKEHDITFRRTSRIISQNGDTTHMIRIYFDTKDETHSAIMNGISSIQSGTAENATTTHSVLEMWPIWSLQDELCKQCYLHSLWRKARSLFTSTECKYHVLCHM